MRKISDKELATRAAKYNDLKEFRERERRTYDIICKRGMIDKLCGHMKCRWRKNVSDDELAEIASRYTSLKDFRKKENPTYRLILSRNLFDKLCGHMERERVSRWTKEELAAIAAKYDVFAEFCEKEPRAFYSIHKHGWLDELCGHMKRGHRKEWTDEELAEVARKYDNCMDFYKNDKSSYTTICVRGLYDKLCGHLKVKAHRTYRIAELKEIASHYDDLKEFIEKERSAYCAIHKRGLLEELCRHMKRSGSLYRRKIYAFTFSDGCAYVGLTLDPLKRFHEHMTGKGHSPILRHIKETGATYEYALLSDWLDKDSAAKVEDAYIRQYKAEGWKMLNRARGGGLGNTAYIYTDAKIRKEVSKYEYVEDFREESFAYYHYLQSRRGMFAKYCSHLKRRVGNNVEWTLESAIEVAQKCRNRTELRVKYHRAFAILSEAGILDKYFPKAEV